MIDKTRKLEDAIKSPVVGFGPVEEVVVRGGPKSHVNLCTRESQDDVELWVSGSEANPAVNIDGGPINAMQYHYNSRSILACW